MADIPKSVSYLERLSPNSPAVEVALPQSRDEAFDWYADIANLWAAGESKRAEWKAAFRQATACDWYMLHLFLSGAQRRDPFTGRPECDCDFIFNYAREKQFDGDGVADRTARGHWKSTLDIYVGVTAELINHPNNSVALFAFEKAAAEKHGRRLKDEWESNVELRVGWDDVFYWNPNQEASLWSQEKGLQVKRSIVSTAPSVSWYSINELPTGLRLSLGILDDIETELTVSTEEARKKLKDRAKSVFNLAGRATRWRVNFTHHHPAGWGADLVASGAWRVRCHAAEDVTKPAPDIAALYDQYDGMLPIREEHGRPIPLPPAVRDIRLEGAPIYLHPLECAQKRLDLGMDYAAQMMGDPLAGQERRLDPDWIRYYDVDPVDWASGANLYLLIDPSKGVGDPTFARVEATKADKTISWVGGLRRRLPPSEFAKEMFLLAMEWVGIGRLVQIRVEEFGQSTWASTLRTYFDTRHQFVAPIIACSSHNKDKRMREWAGLEPLYRHGRRLYPKNGIRVFDELGHQSYDLVKFYVDKEYGLFPLPPTDDGLAADYLLAVPKGKGEDGKIVELALEYPESDEEFDVRTKGRFAGRRWMEDGSGPSGASADGETWMSDL